MRAAMGASVGADLGQPRRLDIGFAFRMPSAGRSDMADGLSIIQPQGPAVDAAVRLGKPSLVIDRDVYRSMARSQDGRKGLVILLAAITTPGAPLELTGAQVRPALDAAYTVNFLAFAEKWQALHKTGANTLIDFNPAGPNGTIQQSVTGSPGGWGGGSTLQVDQRIVWSGDPKQVTEYDAKRADGEHGLPSARQPSNPKAFVRPPVPQPSKPSAAVHAIGLARLIGLTDGDRTFLTDQLPTKSHPADRQEGDARVSGEGGVRRPAVRRGADRRRDPRPRGLQGPVRQKGA